MSTALDSAIGKLEAAVAHYKRPKPVQPDIRTVTAPQEGQEAEFVQVAPTGAMLDDPTPADTSISDAAVDTSEAATASTQTVSVPGPPNWATSQASDKEPVMDTQPPAEPDWPAEIAPPMGQFTELSDQLEGEAHEHWDELNNTADSPIEPDVRPLPDSVFERIRRRFRSWFN